MIIFPSMKYFIFLAIVACVYWRLNHRSQNIFFLLCSYIFYASWDWRFLSIIIGSSCVVYVCTLRSKYSKNDLGKNFYFYFNVVWNLGMLCFFKYANFFVHSLDGFFSYPHVNGVVLQNDILLPLGLSFYTFELLSYSIDVYRGVVEPTRSFIDLALFIAFFPKLTAGPIERAKNLLVQIQRKRTFDKTQFLRGADLIVWGLVKKLIVADNLGMLVNILFAFEKPTLPQLLLGGFCFGIQLYADFSAYTDFARGSAKVLGFNLTKNFNQPFLSRTVMDFWNRWHMSLTSWMKDYLYLPLVFKLAKKQMAAGYIIAIILSWGFIGIWHGSEWKYLVWGLYYAVLIIGYQFILKPVLDLFWKENFFTNLIAVISTYILVNIGFLLIRVPSLRLLWNPIHNEFTVKRPHGPFKSDWDFVIVALSIILFYSIPLLCSIWWQWLQRRKTWDLNQLYGLRIFLYTLSGLLLIIFSGNSQYDFIYFHF